MSANLLVNEPAGVATIGMQNANAKQKLTATIPRIPAIDGLRGIAVLYVILAHCIYATTTTGAHLIDRVADLGIRFTGPLPADCFFVISGYLITTILDRTRDAEHPVRTFYARRALRILPLYYGFLLAALLIHALVPAGMVGEPRSMVWEFLFLTNFRLVLHGISGVGSFFPHFWTLSVEEQFYVMWPVLILLLPRRWNFRTCLTFIVGGSLIRIGVAIATHYYGLLPSASAGDVNFAALFLTPCRLDALAAGALVALLQANHPEIIRKHAKKTMFLSAAALIIVYFVFFVLRSQLHMRASSVLWLSMMPMSAMFFFASMVAWLGAVMHEAPPAWLTSSLLKSVARYSYGMYAVHVPLITLLTYYSFLRTSSPLHGYDLPYRFFFFLVIAGLSWLTGYLSWHFFEKRFLAHAPSYVMRTARGRVSGMTDRVPVP